MKNKLVSGAVAPTIALIQTGAGAIASNVMNQVLMAIPDKDLSPMAISTTTALTVNNVTKSAGEAIINSLGLEDNSNAKLINNVISTALGSCAGIAAGSYAFIAYDNFVAGSVSPLKAKSKQVLEITPNKNLLAMAVSATTALTVNNVTKSTGEFIINLLGLEDSYYAESINDIASATLGLCAGVAAGAYTFTAYDNFSVLDMSPLGVESQY